MKGRNPTAQERIYLNLVGDLGCLICLHFFKIPDCPCSPHHVNGKTKPGAHFEVFGLCGTHHQTGGEGVAIHDFKKQFERAFNTEGNLIILQREKLGIEIINFEVVYV